MNTVNDQISTFIGKQVTAFGKTSTGSDYCYKGTITEIKAVNDWAGRPSWYYLTIDGGKKITMNSWSELEINCEGHWYIRENKTSIFIHQ